MIPEDLLLQGLKQRDQQIADLRASLQAREKRIRELELALLNSLEESDNGDAKAKEAVKPEASAARNGKDIHAESVEHHQEQKLHALLRLDSSSGLCDDNWIEAKSVLALREEVAGHDLQLDLYLPDIPHGAAKPLQVASNFGESRRLMLSRSEVTPCSIRVPAGLKPQLYLELETTAEPRSGEDMRPLGVVVLDVRLAS